MKNRFIVCVNKSTEIQEKEFFDACAVRGFGWWHYLSNTWLLVREGDNIAVAEIRDLVIKYFDDEYNMVFKLNENEGTWAGFGPASEDKNMYKWIWDYWK